MTVWRDFRRGLPQLALYDLLFKAVMFVLISPVTAWLLNTVISSTGRQAIGNHDILRFLASPVGLIALAVMVPVLFALSFMEFSGLMYIGLGLASNRRTTHYSALAFTIKKSGAVFKVGAVWFAGAAVAICPFVLGVFTAYQMLITSHDINYYLSVKPPEFIWAIVIAALLGAGALAVLIRLYLSLVFILPASLFGQGSILNIFKKSRKTVKGSFFQLARPIIIWLVLWLLLSVAVNTVIYFTGELMIEAAGRSTPLLVFVLGLLSVVNILTGVALFFFGTSIGCLLTVRLYLLYSNAMGFNDGSEILAGEVGVEYQPTWKIGRKTVWAIIVLMFGAAAWLSVDLLDNTSFEDRVKITAHRGSSLAAPENTLSSIKQSIVDGADYAEIDVQLTADGVIVAAHDADLMRVSGLPLVISKTNFSELRKADVGGYFGPEFKGEKLPTLAEIIDEVEGKIKLNVELKDYSGQGSLLVAEVVKMLKKRGRASTDIVMSLKLREIEEVRKINPIIYVGYTPAAAIGNISRLDVDFLAVSMALATDSLIGSAHANGKEVHVWTVDRPVDIALMIDRGVDNIITNDPPAVKKVLEERAELSNAERLLLRFRNIYGH